MVQLQKVQQVFVDIEAEVAESDADKENARNAQRDARDFNFSEHCSEGDNQGQNKHRMCITSTPERIAAPEQVFQKSCNTLRRNRSI